MTIMKTAKAKTDSQKLAGAVSAARLRLAMAENGWRAAKEQARTAKRRRKEIKSIARRARKQTKAAKADVADSRKALAKAEAKFAQSGSGLAIRKPAKVKAKPVAKRAAAPKTQAVTTREDGSRLAASSPAPGSVAQVTSVPPAQSDSSPVPPQAGSRFGKADGGIPETAEELTPGPSVPNP